MWKLPLIFGAGVLLAACSGGSSLDRIGNGSSIYRSLPQPSPLPAGILEHSVFRTLDGNDAPLQSVVGQGKVVVLNLWATWCRPCRMEIPTLTTMSRDFHDKGVEILGLSVEDPRESAEAVRMFATQYGIEYRLGFATDEMFEALSGPNQAQVVPQTLVFDKSGKLILHLRGLHPHFAEVLKECLEDML